MKARRDGRDIIMERTETDAPVTPRPYPRPTHVTPAVFNSWRKDYRLHFDSENEAQFALIKVNLIGDFDKAAAWLDKQ